MYSGYNPEEVENLVNSLADGYQKLGEAISQNWTALSNTMKTEWVGPDEYNSEAVIAKSLKTNYESAGETVREAQDNFVSAYNNWKDFQNNNQIVSEGVSADTKAAITRELQVRKAETMDLSGVTAGEPGSFTGNLGLASEGSASTINGQIDAYAEAVKGELSHIFGTLDASAAFMGAEQSQKINEYLGKIGKVIEELNTSFDSLKESVSKATTQVYSDQSSNIGQSFGSVAN